MYNGSEDQERLPLTLGLRQLRHCDILAPRNGTHTSIEGAIEFMQILAEAILEARTELDREHLQAASDGEERRARAIALALFKLKTLNGYVHKSRRRVK